MSGSNDILAQSLLAQVRQRPQQSVQSRLAAQMLEQAQSSAPIYNGNVGIGLRAGQGLLAGLMAGYAQQGDEEREARRLADAERMQAARDQASEARVRAILGGGLGGGAPDAPAPDAAPATVQQEPLPPAAPAPGAVSRATLDTMRGGSGATVPPDLMPHFEAASRETGVPVDLLIAQARRESNFNPYARGAAGEVGIMQVRPTTAQQPGYGVPPIDPALLTDPAENIRFGARYLAGRGRANGATDLNDPAQRAIALRQYNGTGRGGDPNYVANVSQYLPGQGAVTPTAAPANQGGILSLTPQAQQAGMTVSQDTAPPRPQVAPAASAPSAADLRTRALAAAASSDPNVQRLAPLLMQMATSGERTNPTVEMDGPQGPGIYERLPNGQFRMLGGRLPPQAPPRQPNPDYEPDGQGGLRPIRGGPADPDALARRAEATRRATTMPAGLQTQEAEDLTAIGTASGINERLSRFSTRIENELAGRGPPEERLALGPVQNLVSEARNRTGASSPNSRNFSDFRAELARLRNDSLRLNAGVQTEGDAQRAWDELVTNINDPEVVRQRLREIQAINQRGIALREALVQNRRAANGLPELDTSRFRSPGPDATAAPQNAQPGGQGANRLQPGARVRQNGVEYIVQPDGSVRPAN